MSKSFAYAGMVEVVSAKDAGGAVFAKLDEAVELGIFLNRLLWVAIDVFPCLFRYEGEFIRGVSDYFSIFGVKFFDGGVEMTSYAGNVPEYGAGAPEFWAGELA
jgi:hypothetical protein